MKRRTSVRLFIYPRPKGLVWNQRLWRCMASPIGRMASRLAALLSYPSVLIPYIPHGMIPCDTSCRFHALAPRAIPSTPACRAVARRSAPKDSVTSTLKLALSSEFFHLCRKAQHHLRATHIRFHAFRFLFYVIFPSCNRFSVFLPSKIPMVSYRENGKKP